MVHTEHADPDDPLRVTDDTRFLGLIVSLSYMNWWLVYFNAGTASRLHLKQRAHMHVLPLPQVCRGTAVMLVAPSNGMEEIANPFMEQG